MPYAVTEPIRFPVAPAKATRSKVIQGGTPPKIVPLATITPARGMTISLGRGMQALSIAIASTMPAKPVVAYTCDQSRECIGQLCEHKNSLLRFLCYWLISNIFCERKLVA